MPKFLEKKLRANVPAGVDPDKYTYGALNNMGAMKGNKETAKGKRMQAKHVRDMATKTKTVSLRSLVKAS